MLLGLIDRGIHGAASAGTFAAATALVLTTDVAARLILIRLSEKVAYDLRLGLCQRALEAPLWKLEQIGPARLLATLTDDVMTFVTALLAVPSAIVNGKILVSLML
jgi:putative ATP-binding cassette transporter